MRTSSLAPLGAVLALVASCGEVVQPPPEAPTPRADLAVSATGPSAVPTGDAVAVDLTVSNAGPDTATRVRVSATFTGPIPLTVEAGASGIVDGDSVSWPALPALPPGESATFSVTVGAPFAGSVVLRPAVGAETLDGDLSNNGGLSRLHLTTIIPSPALGWELLAGSPTPRSSRFDDLHFATPQRAWLASIGGQIHRTDDGGGTWSLVYDDQSVFFRAIGFTTPDVGWVGNLNTFNSPTPGMGLFETDDGGVTWTSVAPRVTGPDLGGICGIAVVDAATVYAIGRWHGPAVFARTRDGGMSWESFDMAPMVHGLVDVHFFSADTGLITGGRDVGPALTQQQQSRTVILRTEDGGDTWTEAHVSTRLGTWGWKFSFPTPDIGYVAVQGPTLDGIVLKTVDGGRSWSELVVRPNDGYSGIGFATPDLGWVGGDFGTYETTDGGATWLQVDLGSRVNRFRVLSADLMYAAGARVYRFTGR